MSVITTAREVYRDLTPTEHAVKRHMMLWGCARIMPDPWCPRDYYAPLKRPGPYPFIVCNPITLARVKAFIGLTEALS